MKKLLAFAVVISLFAPALAADKAKLTPEEMFKRLDQDKDGKLSLIEFKGKREGVKADAAEKQFIALDKNNDKFLSLEEFKARGGKKAK